MGPVHALSSAYSSNIARGPEQMPEDFHAGADPMTLIQLLYRNLM